MSDKYGRERLLIIDENWQKKNRNRKSSISCIMTAICMR